MTMTERPRIGTMPAATERDDESYLQFVEGMRAFTIKAIDPVMKAEADRAVEEYQRTHGRPPAGLAESLEALERVPVIQTRRRLYRTAQEMFWKQILETYGKRKEDLLAELDRADRMGPGSVEYDPNFPIPDVYRRDIHIQPGGYTEDPLAGYIYHYGTKVFSQGMNDNDDRQRQAIRNLPEPVGGVRRALDMGCAIGQSTTAMKERWSDAEIWGIDIGAPMVRYAHKRAIDMGLEVHFAQRLAEATRFPDGYFDLVYAGILFHEVPVANQEAVVAEARRILRPGGLFVIDDFKTELKGDLPLWELLGFTDARDNCEPYAYEFVHSDLTSKLKRYFSKVDIVEGPPGFNYPRATRYCTA